MEKIPSYEELQARWMAIVRPEFEAAGFAVREYCGLPLIEKPEAMEETVRLLNMPTTFACDRQIFKEGMLILPKLYA